MSLEAVAEFYRELETNAVLRRKALKLQEQFSSQEEIIDAFTALGAEYGFSFSTPELIQFIFTRETGNGTGQ